MSASKEITDLPKKLGILAGNGTLPRTLARACVDKGIEVFVVAFSGQTDADTVHGLDYIWVGLGQVGKALQALRARDISDLVLIGGIKRPSFASLKTDLTGAKIMAKLAVNRGDSSLLSSLKSVLETQGFTLHGMQAFVDNALTPKGILGDVHPTDDDMRDIRTGIEAALDLGARDIGQAVIVRGNIILKEAKEGTDALIDRWYQKGGVLVKLCKPQQDRDLDLPTIGVETLRHMHQSGVHGVAIHAGQSFIAEMENVRALADALGMFVIGIDPEDYQ